jgi:hypothetical protein
MFGVYYFAQGAPAPPPAAGLNGVSQGLRPPADHRRPVRARMNPTQTLTPPASHADHLGSAADGDKRSPTWRWPRPRPRACRPRRPSPSDEQPERRTQFHGDYTYPRGSSRSHGRLPAGHRRSPETVLRHPTATCRSAAGATRPSNAPAASPPAFTATPPRSSGSRSWRPTTPSGFGSFTTRPVRYIGMGRLAAAVDHRGRQRHRHAQPACGRDGHRPRGGDEYG